MKNINIKNVECLTRREIGDLLSSTRKKRGWTRERFASECEKQGFDISEDTIKSYENGNRIPPLPKLICLCHVLGMVDSQKLMSVFDAPF